MSEISLLQMPLDILINIMGNLSYSDLSNVMLTCKSLRDLLLNESTIWRLVSRDTLIINDISHNSQTIELSGFHRSRISRNWCKGIYRGKTPLYRQANFMPWLRMYNSEALLLALGSELQCFPTNRNGFPICNELLWRIQVPVIKRFDIRTNDISRFVVRDSYIICGNRDGCAVVYKIENIRRKPHLLLHLRDCHENGKVEVSAVEMINRYHKPYAVTASSACTSLCFWCLPSEYNGWKAFHSGKTTCSKEICIGKNIGIRCLDVHSTEDKIAVGVDGNRQPLLVELTSGKLLLESKATENSRQAVRDIGWHNNNTIMYVTHSGLLQLLDIRSGEVVFDVMDPFQSTLYCLKSDEQNAIVVGSSEFSRCVLYDTRNSSRHVQMYYTQNRSSPIYTLDFDPTKLIAAADRSIAALNFMVDSNTVKPRDYSQPFEVFKIAM